MKIGVVGMWHLGTVTAGCLASVGYEVLGFDEQEEVVGRLREGVLPVAEPGLAEKIGTALRAGNLGFTSRPSDLAGAEVLWIAYDTPVDEEDRADVEGVIRRVENLFPWLREGSLVIVSSQLPVGSTRKLENLFAANHPGKKVSFACLPENLRLGKAISVFTRPDRVVAGYRTEQDREAISRLLRPFTEKIIWMSVESAEMTKHAINAFLATSVAFINELAVLCESAGADAAEVEQGMKSDLRIGPGAYVKPGAAFAGGTLARDIAYLVGQGEEGGKPTHLFAGVRKSNEAHKGWASRKLEELLGKLAGKKVAVLGLTYKPGTDTLRRSEAVALCRWLAEQGAEIRAFDPAVTTLPRDLGFRMRLEGSASEALRGAEALVLCTPWPQFQELTPEGILGQMASPRILDAARFLGARLEGKPGLCYYTVGKGK